MQKKKNNFCLQSQGLIKGSVPKNKREKKKDFLPHRIKLEKTPAYMFVFVVVVLFFILLHFLAIKL